MFKIDWYYQLKYFVANPDEFLSQFKDELK